MRTAPHQGRGQSASVSCAAWDQWARDGWFSASTRTGRPTAGSAWGARPPAPCRETQTALAAHRVEPRILRPRRSVGTQRATDNMQDATCNTWHAAFGFFRPRRSLCTHAHVSRGEETVTERVLTASCHSQRVTRAGGRRQTGAAAFAMPIGCGGVTPPPICIVDSRQEARIAHRQLI